MSEEKGELLIGGRIAVLRRVMSEKLLWDVVCAFRGPDLKYGDMLKQVLTNTIREIVMGGDRIEDIIKSRMSPGYIETMLEDMQIVEGDLGHYFVHINDAFCALYRLGLIDKDTYKYIDHLLNAIDLALFRIKDTGKLTDDDIEECMDIVRSAFKEWKEVKGIE